jgi:hypothetical protein
MSDIEIVGHFRHRFCRIVYRGFVVPNLTMSEQDDGFWVLFLDNRWGTEPMPKDQILQWIPFIADAQALGAGYARHGAEEKHNPFRVQMVGIGAVSFDKSLPEGPKLALVKDDKNPEGTS